MARNKRAASTPPRVVKTLGEVAKHFDVSSRAVQYWREKGCPLGAPGAFDLAAIARWCAANKPIVAQTAGNKLAHYRAKEARLKAARLALRLARERGQVLETHVVRRVIEVHVAEARALLDQLPDAIAARLAKLPKATAATLRKALAEQATRIAGALADALETLAREIESQTDADGSSR